MPTSPSELNEHGSHIEWIDVAGVPESLQTTHSWLRMIPQTGLFW
jgi:hypothetical protein